MPKKCIKFIPEYLIPNLNNKTFGERLKWIDKNQNIFEIEWRHKAGPEWTEQEAAVFVEWDKHKGHFKPGDKQYYTISKQRFRALLYKLTRVGQLKELKSATKFKKVFCIDQNKKSRRKKTDLNAEYESCNEEEQEYAGSNHTYYRKISEGSINALDDHSYSVPDNSQNGVIDILRHGGENQQVIFNNFQDTCVSAVLSESSDNFQKRILMERNYDNISTLMPDFCTESSPLFGDFKNGLENTTMSTPAAYQNSFFPENSMVADILSPLQNLDMLELLQAGFEQNIEEKK